MLHYYPDSRASASELVNHPWLAGVVVQGELEMEERVRKGEAVAGGALSGENGKARTNTNGNGNGNGTSKKEGGGKEKEEKEKEKKVPFEEIAKLGPKLKGMVGMGRI